MWVWISYVVWTFILKISVYNTHILMSDQQYFSFTHEYRIYTDTHHNQFNRGSRIYNYICNHSISPLTLWDRTPFMARCFRWKIILWSLSVTCDRSVVFSGYSGFPHQYNWPPQYNWNIVESVVKNYQTNIVLAMKIHLAEMTDVNN